MSKSQTDESLGAKKPRKSRAAGLYRTVRTMFQVLEEMRSGKAISTKNLEERFKVKKAAALRYKQLLQDQLGVSSRARGGRAVLEHKPTGDSIARAAGLEIAISMVPWLQGTSYHLQLTALASEVREKLSVEDQDRLDRLIASFYVKRRDAARAPRFPKTLETLVRAIRTHQRSKIQYTKLDGTTSDYTIDPLFLAVIDDAVFVRALKLPSREPRLFDLTGIHSLEVLDQRYPAVPLPEQDPNKIFRDTVGTYTTDDRAAVDVALLVRGSAHVRLSRRPLHSSQTGSEVVDGWCRINAKVAICPELVATILSLLPDVRVLNPTELRQQVREAAAAAQGSLWDP